jgi:hypothetical protein
MNTATLTLRRLYETSIRQRLCGNFRPSFQLSQHCAGLQMWNESKRVFKIEHPHVSAYW